MVRKSFRRHWGGGRLFGGIFVAIIVMLVATLGFLNMPVLKAGATAGVEATEMTDEPSETADTGESTDADATGNAAASGADASDTDTGASGNTEGETEDAEDAATREDVDDTENPASAAAGEDEEAATAGPILQVLQNHGDSGDKSCKKQLGALGWLICPTTGKVAEAVDWLYDRIEGVLVINPIAHNDNSPVYQIWKYLRGIMNIVFIIFLLVVVYSQITGMGISNYGIKQALPKLIVAAVMANLSFIICSVLIDLSNITGDSLRGLFKTIQMETFGGMDISHLNLSSFYAALGGVVGLGAIGVAVAVELGAVWMLIPVVLGAIVAVVSGLITVSFRQAMVILLLMVAPLAFGANVFPNLDTWFKKWKNMLFQMLIFYPMFSLLFGASSFAGWAIIMAAGDGFGIMLGVAVQIFPLFFSWSLMKLSGTALDKVSGFLRGVGGWAVAKNVGWATSHSQLMRARNLAKIDSPWPQTRLMQYLSNRRIAREIDTKELNEHISKRGADYAARLNYQEDGTVSRHGERVYERAAYNMRYDQTVMRHQNNMDEGMGVVNRKVRAELYGAAEASRIDARQARLDRLDIASMNAADQRFNEQVRAENVEYNNTVGRQKRYDDAINAHFDAEYRARGGTDPYKTHFNLNDAEESRNYATALERYDTMSQTMYGDASATQYVASAAATAFDTQTKIHASKMQKYFEHTEPTADVVHRLAELTSVDKAQNDIDAIIAGMRVLNQRGDTDLLKDALDSVLDERHGGVQLGTHASQSLASFLMFEVKDNDPFLRRFGKYINLETAAVFNKGERINPNVTYAEYLKGSREEWEVDNNGNFVMDGDRHVTHTVAVKKPASILVQGTSFDGIERTAMSNFDSSLKKVYTDEHGHLDTEAYYAKRDEIITSIMPAFISSSLKHPSGSEALRSEVNFMTGYANKPEKDSSGRIKRDEHGDPVYHWEAEWEAKNDDGSYKYTDEQQERMRKHYREQTKKYLKAQTPAQILGLRTDYQEGLEELLIDQWLEDHPEEASAYNDAVMAIQSDDFGKTNLYEINTAREQAKKALRKDLRTAHFGEELQKVLGTEKGGTVEQIRKMARTSAAGGAKGWVRKALGMSEDDERPTRMRPDVSSDDADTSVDTGLDAELTANIDAAFNNPTLSAEDFYLETLADLIAHRGSDDFIVRQYESYHDASGAGLEKGACRAELLRLLSGGSS